MVPTVAVLGTGGTIASIASEDGATPSLSSTQLVEAVPTLTEYAELMVEQVAQTPSFDMDLGTLWALREAVGDVADSADGVVVTHGTDTMEESAYILDLTLDAEIPVVFTGAQRTPDEISADGPANMETAVRAASHESLQESGGVYIAFDEQLHTARDATKTHTRKLDTFASAGKGPVAEFTRETVRFYRDLGSRTQTFAVDGDAPTMAVPIVNSYVGASGAQIDRAVERGVDGIVIDATGLGNTTASMGKAVERAIAEGLPVVVTSRCVAGPTAPVYGTPGGGQTLQDHGAIFGGDLSAQKARLKLMVALSETTVLDELRGLFSDD